MFTGALEISRREAADLAASVGCEVAQGVTKATTLLVVGDVDVKRLAGHDKSSKHRKVEELMAKGRRPFGSSARPISANSLRWTCSEPASTSVNEVVDGDRDGAAGLHLRGGLRLCWRSLEVIPMRSPSPGAAGLSSIPSL